ncbi:pyruvate dehydrogenase complex dihydrolipoamide acetyltransferase [Sphingomonas sp. CFBP 8760]|uniref:pyruvate dehydrogenase complex dihydrolipoamide acetyltransferase n=1 Tax=Sphingomonas sp. CFBP 8760 TaxID=2775282 RepID=UPI00177E8788|nr:pyruvate dehydrogenase complex dihydrolipoamide acetyltransferase [Sphingomonas sp. CFBP 8760]MBD8545384.1 pyruvate dehydrogenase complex dihydrolipoamide acetyltransferase [Sphingomonas sp. CFBP 8760]
MPIEIKMPALSPTMEEGTLAKWLVKEGDTLKSGDIMAEIETDKATMEFEAVDEGVVARVLVAEGTDNVKVGTVIAILVEEGEDASAVDAPAAKAETPQPTDTQFKGSPDPTDPNAKGNEGDAAPRTETQAEDHGRPADAGPAKAGTANAAPAKATGDRVKASPLARRLAEAKGLDLAAVSGSGPNGRIVKADVDNAKAGAKPATQAAPADAPVAAAAPASAPRPAAIPDIPHETAKLSNMRKTIARRLTESKQTVPHIYLTVDVRLDALMKLRGELNASLESRGVKLSVNDLLVKALAVSLMAVPKCNVMFTPDQLVTFKRADISVAVSTPSGLITPIVKEADTKSLSAISTEVKDLAARARDNKLKPEEFQGGTASISNMGMFGIKQFEAVINPPQGMILAIGAGEKRPYIVDGELGVATVMSATGSFDHRAIDGADGAELMKMFKELVERPLGMLA